MTHWYSRISAFVLVVLVGLVWLLPVSAQMPLTLVATIPLPNVTGRIDHLAFEPTLGRLFVAALGNNTVEVIDVMRRARVTSIPGFHEPQGIAVVPQPARMAVANGNTGTLQLFDANSLQTRWTVTIGGDADNVRYDAAARHLLVAAQGGISLVDPDAGAIVRRIAIAGHPESFQLDAGSDRVFANLPGASQIVVANRATASVTARWPTGDCGSNYPMAFDAASGRLFVGCRRPAALATFDAASGRAVSSIPIVGDSDDLFYDAARSRLYVIGGEGFVDVVTRNGDALQQTARIPTRAGARTGLWVPDKRQLFVAVPARGGESAEIRVFDAAN